MRLLLLVVCCFWLWCSLGDGQGDDDRCGQYVFALRGDTCDQLRTSFHVSTRDFERLNPNLDCQRLRPRESRVCVASRRQSREWTEDSARRCPGPRVKTVRGDTCSKIGARLDVDEEHFVEWNRGVDCAALAVGDTVCGAPQASPEEEAPASVAFTAESSISFADGPSGVDPRPRTTSTVDRCPGKFVEARGNETCAYFRQQHNIGSDEEFRALNPTIDCSRGPIERGRAVCIRRPRITYKDLTFTRRRGIENMQLLDVNCTKWYRIQSGDTCWTIWNAAQLSERAFHTLNPGLDCSAVLKVGEEVCVRNRSLFGKPCRLTYTVQVGQTCSSIASLAKLTVTQLISLNPVGLDCNRPLEPKKQICLSVEDSFDKEPIQHDDGTRAEQFLQSASTRLTQRNLIDQDTARKIERLISGQTVDGDSTELVNVLAQEKSIGLIKAVTESNPNFRRLASEFDQRRALICVQLTEGETAYKTCVCDQEKPFIHCQAILMKSLQTAPTSTSHIRHKKRHAKHRSKRQRQHQQQHQQHRPRPTDSNINLDFRSLITTTTAKPNQFSSTLITVGGAFAEFWRYFQKLCPNCVEEGCLAVGACFIIPPAPVFEVCVSGGACLPNPAMLITTDRRLTVNQFFTSQINVGVGICITGVNAVLKLVGLAACVASVDLRYYYLRQQMELHPQVALVVVRAYLDALVQIGNSLSRGLYDSDNNVPLADLCLEEAYQCSDFCQLDRGGVVVRYNVEVWFFGWRSVKKGDIKGLPECKPKMLPAPDSLRRLVVFATSGTPVVGTTRPEHCKRHDLALNAIPTNLGITHVIFGYLTIDPRTFKVNEGDQGRAIEDLLRSKESMRVMVSVGGRAFCESPATMNIFPTVVVSEQNRRAFIDSLIEYATRRGLHGIDLGWTNPEPADRAPYSALITELRAAIGRSGVDLLLSISGPKSAKNIDLARVSGLVDFINLLTFDYHEPKDSYKPDSINVHAPIVDCGCSQEGDVELTVEEYLNEGVPSQKLNLGLSTYGRAFKLEDDWRRENKSAGYVRGECSGIDGLLAWHEIKTRVEEIRIDNKTMSAYAAYGKMEWIGFDNPDTLAMKLCFARYKILGGVSVWNANHDDNFELIESIGKLVKTPSIHDCSTVEISRCDRIGENGTRRSLTPDVEDERVADTRASKPSKPASSSSPTCSSSTDSKRCSQAICTTPPSVLNADRSKLTQCGNRAAGSVCVVECSPGYEISGITATVVCVRLFSSFAMWLPTVKCEMNEEAKRMCGGDSSTPIVPVFETDSSSSSSSAPMYVAKFNKGNGLPAWSVYLSKRVDSGTSREFRFSRYHCHQDDQLGASKYRNLTDYVKSQLTPQTAFDSTPGRRGANYMINVAAQDRRTRHGPWRVLERRTAAFLESRSNGAGIVATGVCPTTLDHQQQPGSDANGTRAVPIPSCFWKLICVKAAISGGERRATVAAFYHDNSPVRTETRARIDQIKEVRDQNFVKSKLGSSESTIADVWTSAKQWLWPTAVPSNDYPTPEECAGRLTLGNDEKQFWREMITDQRYGPDWNEFDEEGSRGDASDVDEEENLLDDDYLAYGVRRQPYERCGKIINGPRRK